MIFSFFYVVGYTSATSLCGKSHDALDAINNPPEIIQEFVDYAFGTQWGIGDLTEVGDSCEELGEYTDGLDYMYVQQKGPGDTKAGQLIMDRAAAEEAKNKKCQKKNGKNCPKVTKAAKIGGALEKVDSLEIFPICMAYRPCDKHDSRFLLEHSFGLMFGGSGVPVGMYGPFAFYFKSIILSTSGDLVPATDLLLDTGSREAKGMHIMVKGSVDFSVTRTKKKILTVEATVGVGVYGQIVLSNGEIMNSPSKLLEMLIDIGADVKEFVGRVQSGKFRNFESDLFQSPRSATLQLFGDLEAEITIHLRELLKMSQINDLQLKAKGQWQLEMHCNLSDMKKTRVAIWQAVEVELDLSSIFKLLGPFGDALPQMNIMMTYKHYMATYFSPWRVDYQMVLGIAFDLNCGALMDIIDIIADIITFVGSHISGAKSTLEKAMQDLKDTVNSICSKHELSVSVAFTDGTINTHETYIAFNSNKLRLSDLPTCPSVNGIQPGGKCSENADCWSATDKYNDGSFKSRRGYCLNHKTWKTAIACYGRCIKKIHDRHSCSKSDMNLPFWQELDAANAEHVACQSGRCLCGVCADKDSKKLANDFHCSTDSDCSSGWCEGRSTTNCAGVCKPKRGHLQSAWCDFLGCFDASCQSGKIICGKCAQPIMWGAKKVFNNYKCSKNSDCYSGWCEGRATTGCAGWCKPKRNPLTWPWCDWGGCFDDSCFYPKIICSKCAKSNMKVPNGYQCSTDSDCESGWCEGRYTTGCAGRCRARRAGGHHAYCDGLGCFSASCQHGKYICGKCAYSNGRVHRNSHCSSDRDCADGSCKCRSWFCFGVFGCQGAC